MPAFTDPLSLRAALERQLTLLLPVALHLRSVGGPALAVPGDWHGPAATACRDREAELRDLLRVTGERADETVDRLRLALAGLA